SVLSSLPPDAVPRTVPARVPVRVNRGPDARLANTIGGPPTRYQGLLDGKDILPRTPPFLADSSFRQRMIEQRQRILAMVACTRNELLQHVTAFLPVCCSLARSHHG